MEPDKLRKALDALAKANAWTKEDRVEYVREYKRAQRRKALPPDMRCPMCGEIKLESKRWVVFDPDRVKGHPEATRVGQSVCRSCAIKHFRGYLWFQ